MSIYIQDLLFTNDEDERGNKQKNIYKLYNEKAYRISNSSYQLSTRIYLKNKYKIPTRSSNNLRSTSSFASLLSRENDINKKNIPFLQRSKRHELRKELILDKIRNKSFDLDSTELKIQSFINEGSIPAIKYKDKKKKKKPKIRSKKGLNLTFQSLGTIKPKQISFKSINFTKINKSMDMKYAKFYEKEKKWKITVEQKREAKRYINKKIYDNSINELTFRPKISKNSRDIAQRLQILQNENSCNRNNFYENGFDVDNLDKFKIKIKSIVNSLYNYDKCNFFITKKKDKINKFSSKKNKISEKNEFQQKKTPKISKIYKKPIISEILGWPKFEEKKVKRDSKNDNLENKSKNLLEMKRLDLYKLNIRQGTSWNNNIVNSVTSRRNDYPLVNKIIKYINSDD